MELIPRHCPQTSDLCQHLVYHDLEEKPPQYLNVEHMDIPHTAKMYSILSDQMG